MAVQCRADDLSTLDLLKPLDHPATRSAVVAERAFLSGLGGGCSAPVAAYALTRHSSLVSLTGLVASLDGQRIIRLSHAGNDPLEVGTQLAQQALAHGAAELIA